MKKLTALALILLLLLSLTACAAEPQQAVGLSLEEAGIVADLPFTPVVPDLPNKYPENNVIDIRLEFYYGGHKASSSANLGGAPEGTFDCLGNASPLQFGWNETIGDAPDQKPLYYYTVIGQYQAYRKSDLETGKVIKAAFTLKQGNRFSDNDPELTYSVCIDKKNVRDSYFLVAETEEYYIFDWFTLIVGDNLNDLKNRIFTRLLPQDNYNSDSFNAYINTLKSLLLLKENITFAAK